MTTNKEQTRIAGSFINGKIIEAVRVEERGIREDGMAAANAAKHVGDS